MKNIVLTLSVTLINFSAFAGENYVSCLFKQIGVDENIKRVEIPKSDLMDENSDYTMMFARVEGNVRYGLKYYNRSENKLSLVKHVNNVATIEITGESTSISLLDNEVGVAVYCTL